MKRNTYQQSRRKTSEIDPKMYRNLVYDEGNLSSQGIKMDVLITVVGSTG